jgi:P-type Ca2+ transporter type 2C
MRREVLTAQPAAVYGVLDSSPRGLSDQEAAARLVRYGANELPPPPRRSLVRWFGAQFTDMFAVVLLAASVITFVTYLLQSPREAGTAQLAAAILGVVVLNAVIGFAQEYSAERTVQALQAMVPRTGRVLRDGQRREEPVARLVPGDVIAVEAGDAVPADARLVESHGLSLDNAALTGESEPAPRRADADSVAVAALEARNCVFMGTTVASGTGKAVVYATAAATEFGRIFRLTTETAPQPTPLQRQVAVMARRVSGVALSVGALLFLVRAGLGSPVVATFVFALGVMVACVPEGLPATMSVSLAVGVRRMARQHALVKRLLAVEALGSTTVICTDKTGTLTQAEMTVQRCWAAGRFHALTGVGYAPAGQVEDAAALADLLRTAALCSNARLVPPADGQPWRVLGDPTEGALLVAAAKAGIDLTLEEGGTPRVAEFPFDPERKLMSTVHKVDAGYAVYVKGSPQELLDRCDWIAWPDGQRRDGDLPGGLRPLDDELRAQVSTAADEMAGGSLRVLGVATGTADQAYPPQETAESKLTLLGLVGMLDPPRPAVADAVRACRTAGIRIIMVTGDHPLTGEAIARRVGIVSQPRPTVITGRQLSAMSEENLRTVLTGDRELLFCRVSPEHKMRIVAELEGLGEVVAVTGDGANDAPALKRADIGVAMGASGTDVARQAAAMVLLDDSFASIVTAVEVGRSVYRNIRKFLVYVFCSNVGELTPILAATFVGFPLVPLTAVQVLAIDLGSDVLPALALGAEPPERDTMRERPRPRTQPLFTAGLLGRVLFLGLLQSVGVIVAFFWTIHAAGLPFDAFTADNPVYHKAITMSQAAIVVSQIFVGLAVRSDRQSIFSLGLLSNPRYIAAQCIGVAFVAAISYVPTLQAIFHTAPLNAADWALVFAFGGLLLLADEVRKVWVRRRTEPRTGERRT